MNLLQRIIIMALAGLALPLCAANVTQVNRYATVDNEPLLEQLNPMKAVQQVHFPLEVKTIGDAVNYWLHYSGFHLADADKHPKVLQQVLNQPLPQVDRNLGPLSIDQGLLVLVGKNEFRLEEVAFTREINFHPKGSAA